MENNELLQNQQPIIEKITETAIKAIKTDKMILNCLLRKKNRIFIPPNVYLKCFPRRKT